MWSSRQYRTRDRVIPFGLFWIYLEAISSNLALERLSESRAVGHAIGLAFRGQKETGLPELLRIDQRDAYVAE